MVKRERELRLKVYELTDEELEAFSGGGQHGGPICPKCGSTNVVFDAKAHVVISCNVCGYHS